MPHPTDAARIRSLRCYDPDVTPIDPYAHPDQYPAIFFVVNGARVGIRLYQDREWSSIPHERRPRRAALHPSGTWVEMFASDPL